MPGRRELVLLGAVGVAAGIAGALVGVFGLQRSSGAADLLSVTLPDLQRRPTSLRSWQGQVLVVNFWATWCAPCLEEMPLLSRASEDPGLRGLQVVGIALDMEAKVQEFADKMRVQYPLLIAGSTMIPLMQKLGNPSGGLPFTAILDRSGGIAGRKLGAFKPGELEAIVRPLLG